MSKLDQKERLVYNFISRHCWQSKFRPVLDLISNGTAPVLKPCLRTHFEPYFESFSEVLVATFALILFIANALLVIILMALQTDKVEQGGVMGLGGAGGRQAGSVDVLVGAERILKPATRWSCIGFLFSAIFAASHTPNIGLFAALLAVYLLIMLTGNRIWSTVLGLRS